MCETVCAGSRTLSEAAVVREDIEIDVGTIRKVSTGATNNKRRALARAHTHFRKCAGETDS